LFVQFSDFVCFIFLFLSHCFNVKHATWPCRNFWLEITGTRHYPYRHIFGTKNALFTGDVRGGGILDMSLTKCPECGHEVSTIATECPNCGYHAPAPATVEPVVRGTVVTGVSRRRRFPGWVFIPLGIIGVMLLFFVIMMAGRPSYDEANANKLSVNIAAKHAADAPIRNDAVTDTPAYTAPVTEVRGSDMPPMSTPTPEAQTAPRPRTVSQQPAASRVPASVPASNPASSAAPVPVPAAEPVPAGLGMVLMEARTVEGNDSPEAVKNEKFYLLDEDAESILNEEGLIQLEGQSFTNSLGLSLIYPERYSNFHRDALNAIGHHIKYSVQTDSMGRAQIRNVKPNNYYLFGITRTGKSYAVWNSPVTVTTGQNTLNLSPLPLTDAPD
jgi:hypothetical protein